MKRNLFHGISGGFHGWSTKRKEKKTSYVKKKYFMSCRQGTYMRDVESHLNFLFPYFFSPLLPFPYFFPPPVIPLRCLLLDSLSSSLSLTRYPFCERRAGAEILGQSVLPFSSPS